MASATSKACCSGLLILVMMQIIAAGVLVEGAGLQMTIENEMNTVGQKLDFHCHIKGGQDLGQLSLMPFNSYSWTYGTSILGTDIVTCTFATPGKPITTIDVFKGYVYPTRPCSCVGVTRCYWQALNEGFWCNSKFVQKWG